MLGWRWGPQAGFRACGFSPGDPERRPESLELFRSDWERQEPGWDSADLSAWPYRVG